ncbi:hypothetical protein [Vibrio owensii]|uniref:hypothetical protein n=1 Tax=Vibrio owensii TaxID=696485 RepID=UPI00406914C4
MRFKTVLLSLLLPVLASANQVDITGKIKDQFEYPVDKIIFLEMENGTFLILTGDGKFVIKEATLFSTLRAKTINTVEEFAKASQNNFDDLSIDPEQDLLGFYVNSDASEFGGTLFASPTCTSCKALIKMLTTSHKDKKFKVIPTPILSEDEFRNTVYAQCAINNDEAIIAVMENRWSKSKYPIESGNPCNKAAKAIQLNIAALQMLSTPQMGVPTLVNAKNEKFVGLPISDSVLSQFLSSEKGEIK